MLDIVSAGPLMGAWLGIWDVVAGSPDAAMILIGGLFSTVMAGLAMALFGAKQAPERRGAVPVVVQAPRPSRRVRRRR